MTLPVHLAPDLSTAVVGATVTLDGDEGHHAVAVRRLGVGEQVVLTDGAGHRAVATITATAKKSLDLVVDSVEFLGKPEPRFTVVQALPKADRGERAVEVMTEIGVDLVVPWTATRSVVSWRGERGIKPLARWRSTSREAAKQARRSWLPTVAELETTTQIESRIAAAALAVVLHEEAGGPIADIEVPAVGEILLIIGPEGGLTSEEVTAFVAAGAVQVKLGDEVLRTSTAGLAAMAALLPRTPRWR